MKIGVRKKSVLSAFLTTICAMSAQVVSGQHIMAVLQDHEVWGHGWMDEGTIEVRIGEAGDWTYSATTWADQSGHWIVRTYPFEIYPGQVVQVQGETSEVEHEVLLLAVTDIDIAADRVSGTAGPNSAVRVEIHEEDVFRDVTADANGEWAADFSVSAGSQHQDRVFNIQAGTSGYANRFDSEWHVTQFRWHAPQPHFKVTPQHDHLWGHDWPANDTVTIKLGDPVAVIGTAEVNEWGDFWFDSPEAIQPGDWVHVECGDILKTHIVMDLAITIVDPENDTVGGTAAPETWVDVGVHDSHVRRHVQANEHGDWIADFSESVGEDPWDAAYDLTAGSGGYAEQRDEEGDATSVNWHVVDPILRVELHYNNVRGQGWPPHAAVEVTIGDPADPDYSDAAHANHQGEWWLHIDDYDHRLRAGDVVTADDGLYTRTMTVPILEVTGVDPDNNVVSGIAPAETEVMVRIGEVTLTTTADENGEWQVDFSGQANIEEGTEGRLFLEDGDGNITGTRWRYATLDIMELSIFMFSFPEEAFHMFGFEIEVDGLLSARFKAPSGEWYDIVPAWDEWWWVFDRFYSSMEAMDAEFGRGEYLLELTHYHGVLELALNLSEEIEIPNATPEVISPQGRRSDVDPDNVEIVWEDVTNPNFQAVYMWIEDEIFGYQEGEGYYEAIIPVDNGMPTQHTIGELKSNRLYMAGVGFLNIDENVTGGDLQVEYGVFCLVGDVTAFSTNTDEDLFDPIDLVQIDRGHESTGRYTFEFEIEFSEPLQVPGESPLFHRLMLWTPEDEYYTLFDATEQSEFGDLVEFYIEKDNIEDLPGSGWYALVVQKDDASAVATWFLFAEPESEAPLQMLEQMPVITQPQPDSVVANPVTFSWDPVTDEAINLIGVLHAPEEFVMLGDEATEYSPPDDLPVGPQYMLVVFGEAYEDLLNADSIPYVISQYIVNGVDFMVGYTLTYEAGAGGWLEGPVEQVVPPGASGAPVEAFAEGGALFHQWDDGYSQAVRTDDGVQADATATAQFSSAGGVSIDWYASHQLAPGDGEIWADLDDKDPHDKGMTRVQEFVALTDPNDPQSLFRMEEVSGPPFQYRFQPSSPERIYTLQYTDDLRTGEWNEVDGPRPGLGGDEDYMVDHESEALRVYRMKVELP